MLKKIPFHPFLIVIFPLLSLYVSNINQLLFSEVAVTILIALLGGAAFWFVVNLVIRDLAKSAFLASIFLFLFFSFRSFLTGFEMTAVMLGVFKEPYYLSENVTWLVIWLAFLLILWLVISWRIMKWNINSNRLNQLMNFISIMFMLSVSYYWISSVVKASQNTKMSQAQFDADWEQQVSTDVNLQKEKTQSFPTIYYIILDGYARKDVLNEIYQVDNAPFIDFLNQKGFYVADKATSNYKSTALSLSSSLNYMYLDEPIKRIGEGLSNENILKTLIAHNRVFAQFRSLGYQIVTYSTGFDFTEISTADIKLSGNKSPNNFQNTLIGNTPLSIFLLGNQYQWHRQHIQFTLSHLSDPTSYSQPTFVFAHILAPHPPFVLDENGGSIHPNRIFSMFDGGGFMVMGTPEEYKKGYCDQLSYINSQLRIALQKILDESETPPIIIIQSDHGPGLGMDHKYMELSDLHERQSILNAFYLPGGKTSQIYSSISPVNTFRVIFNEYFGADFPLLDDRNYYSSLYDFTNFVDITDRVQPTK